MLLFGSESITAEGYGEGCSAKRIGCLDANQLLSTQHGLLSACGCEAEACNPLAIAPDTPAGISSGERRRQTQAFLRLYMVPGMAHCAGGPGATHYSTATRDSDPPIAASVLEEFRRPLPGPPIPRQILQMLLNTLIYKCFRCMDINSRTRH
jgi:hypothetical protein